MQLAVRRAVRAPMCSLASQTSLSGSMKNWEMRVPLPFEMTGFKRGWGVGDGSGGRDWGDDHKTFTK